MALRDGESRRLPVAKRSGYAKSADTRARILAAALQEASDSGIHQTSLAAIASRAGVAIGSLNYHFGSREELLRELMGSLTADLMSRLHATDANDERDFFELERDGMLAYLAHLRANPTYLRLAGEIELHEPELYRRAVASWHGRVTEHIRVGIARGDLRAMGDAEIAGLAYVILGAGQFLDHRVHRNGSTSPDDAAVVDAYLALLRGGIGRVPRQGSVRRRVPGPAAGSPAPNIRRMRPAAPTRSERR